jgi:hypothetical protein
MQAYIEIKIQRNQATGKLTFDPHRVLDTPEHNLIQKGFDRLIEDLNDIVSSGVASNSSNVPGEAAAPVEVENKGPEGPAAAPTSTKDLLAQGVKLVPEEKAKPTDTVSITNSPAQSRLEEAKSRGAELVKPAAPSVGVIGTPPEPTTVDDLAQGVKVDVNSEDKK